MKKRVITGLIIWGVLMVVFSQAIGERPKQKNVDVISREAYDRLKKRLEGERDIEKVLRIHYQMQVRGYELMNKK